MLELRGSKAGLGVLAALAVAGLGACGEESREGDKPGPASPPGQILTVPGSEQGGGTTTSAESVPAPGVTKAEYIERADDVCAEAQPAIDAAERAAEEAANEGDLETAADRFAEGLAESEREIAELRALEVPAGSEETLDRMYAGIEEANRLFRASIARLRVGQVAEFNAVGERARLAARDSRRIANRFGFQVCGLDR
jgi:hypothetical protein